jgi:hypothetical protein
MAQRLDLSEHTSGGGSLLGAPMGLLDDHFAGAGLRGINYDKLGDVTDQTMYDLTKGGQSELGLRPYEEVWGAQGMLKDEMLLMQYLNIANVMNQDQNPWLRSDPGTAPDWYRQRLGSTGYEDVGYDPYMQTGYDTGNWEDAMAAWLYNQSYRGHDYGRSGMGRSYGDDVQGAYYDPELLRYTDASQFRGMRAADLDEWAKTQGAASLWDLISKPTALLEEEARWRNDPSTWFNPMAPTESMRQFGTTGLGLGAAGAMRMSDLQDAMKAYSERQGNLRAMGPEMFTSHMMRQDPQYARTGIGQFHGAMAPISSQASGLYGGFAPYANDYSYLMQQAMQPYLMQQQLGNYFNRLQ